MSETPPYTPDNIQFRGNYFPDNKEVVHEGDYHENIGFDPSDPLGAGDLVAGNTTIYRGAGGSDVVGPAHQVATESSTSDAPGVGFEMPYYTKPPQKYPGHFTETAGRLVVDTVAEPGFGSQSSAESTGTGEASGPVTGLTNNRQRILAAADKVHGGPLRRDPREYY